MEYISIGKIVNTHGIKGELKVESWSDFDEERYRKGNTVYICHQNRYLPFTAKACRFHKNHTLVTLEGIDSIDLAEQYKNDLICIDAEDRDELPEGEYYQDDLRDMTVCDEEGNVIGTVIDMEETSASQNRLRIETEEGKQVLVPFVPAFIKDVDFEEETITIHVMEGLL